MDPETGEIIEDARSNAGEYSVSEIANALKRTLEDTFGHAHLPDRELACAPLM